MEIIQLMCLLTWQGQYSNKKEHTLDGKADQEFRHKNLYIITWLLRQVNALIIGLSGTQNRILRNGFLNLTF